MMTVAVVAMSCLQNVDEPTMRFRVAAAGGESRQVKPFDSLGYQHSIIDATTTVQPIPYQHDRYWRSISPPYAAFQIYLRT
jgi:hypothetical protein